MCILLTDATGRNDRHENIITESRGKPVPASWGKPHPDDNATTPERVLEASQALVAAGFSVIPIDGELGSKSPDCARLPRPCDPIDGLQKPKWGAYQIRRPTPDELLRWFNHGTPYGLAVLGGSVSGGRCGIGLEIIDFDQYDLAEPWMQIVEQRAPGLVDRLVRIKTPRPGLHCYYRCAKFGVNQKLASMLATDDYGQAVLDRHANPIRKTLIESKAEGGYCIAPPSPPRCHPTCRTYEYVSGSPDLTSVPTISPDERELLIGAAKELNKLQEPACRKHGNKKRVTSPNLLLPGDDFNARADWKDILEPHGWSLVGSYGNELRWCRPGKSGTVSASLNHYDNGILHVFTTSSDLTAGNYTKFSAYTFLNHGGNFKEAARDLGKQGFGKQKNSETLSMNNRS